MPRASGRCPRRLSRCVRVRPSATAKAVSREPTYRCRAPWRRTRLRAWWPTMPTRQPVRARPASTWSRSTPRTATCCTSSCRPTATTAPMRTADRWTTDCACCPRSWTRVWRHGQPTGSGCASPPSARSTAWRIQTVRPPDLRSPARCALATWPSYISPSRTGPADRCSTMTIAARCARRTTASSSEPAITTSPRRNGCSTRASSTRRRSGVRSSPTRISPGGCATVCRSIRSGSSGFYGGDGTGYTDYPAYDA
jgi:hypothetical protein